MSQHLAVLRDIPNLIRWFWLVVSTTRVMWSFISHLGPDSIVYSICTVSYPDTDASQALIRSAECLHNGQSVDQGYIYKHTKGLLFLGTPHRGSEQTKYADIIAKVATAALRQPNKKLVEILRQDSDVLEGQRSSFSAISRDLPIACIYETVPMGIGMVSSVVY